MSTGSSEQKVIKLCNQIYETNGEKKAHTHIIIAIMWKEDNREMIWNNKKNWIQRKEQEHIDVILRITENSKNVRQDRKTEQLVRPFLMSKSYDWHTYSNIHLPSAIAISIKPYRRELGYAFYFGSLSAIS